MRLQKFYLNFRMLLNRRCTRKIFFNNKNSWWARELTHWKIIRVEIWLNCRRTETTLFSSFIHFTFFLSSKETLEVVISTSFLFHSSTLVLGFLFLTTGTSVQLALGSLWLLWYSHQLSCDHHNVSNWRRRESLNLEWNFCFYLDLHCYEVRNFLAHNCLHILSLITMNSLPKKKFEIHYEFY